jgi:hypothetical protein
MGPNKELNGMAYCLELRYNNRGGFYLKTLLREYSLPADELLGVLFLLNISKDVREALRIEIIELTSNYWEFDKECLLKSEWNGVVQ